MVIGFCGHSNSLLNEEEKILLQNTLISIIENNSKCVFYLGGYGNFDEYCRKILNCLKEKYNYIEIVFVTPYIYSTYYKLEWAKDNYDYTLYPPLEKTPLKYCILKRNEWIIDNSDFLICNIYKRFGGAYTTFTYAKKRGIPYINISSNK